MFNLFSRNSKNEVTKSSNSTTTSGALSGADNDKEAERPSPESKDTDTAENENAPQSEKTTEVVTNERVDALVAVLREVTSQIAAQAKNNNNVVDTTSADKAEDAESTQKSDSEVTSMTEGQSSADKEETVECTIRASADTPGQSPAAEQRKAVEEEKTEGRQNAEKSTNQESVAEQESEGMKEMAESPALPVVAASPTEQQPESRASMSENVQNSADANDDADIQHNSVPAYSVAAGEQGGGSDHSPEPLFDTQNYINITPLPEDDSQTSPEADENTINAPLNNSQVELASSSAATTVQTSSVPAQVSASQVQEQPNGPVNVTPTNVNPPIPQSGVQTGVVPDVQVKQEPTDSSNSSGQTQTPAQPAQVHPPPPISPSVVVAAPSAAAPPPTQPRSDRRYVAVGIQK